MSTNGIITLIIANIPVYLFLGWVLFDSWGKFFQTMDNARRNQYGEMYQRNIETVETGGAKIRILFFLFSCFSAVVAEYKFIVWWFGE